MKRKMGITRQQRRLRVCVEGLVLALFFLVAGTATLYGQSASQDSAERQETAGRRIVIRKMTEFRDSVPLVARRTHWNLRNKVELSGSAVSSLIEDYVVIRNPSESPYEPDEVLVELSEFSDADRRRIETRINRGFSYVRYQYLPTIARAIERWNGTPPANAEDFTNIVAVDRDKVMAIGSEGLLAVEHDDVAPEELARLKQRFAALGNGNHLQIDAWLPGPIAGKVIFQTDESFVLETGPLPTGTSRPVPEGTRFHLPKNRMGAVLTRELSAILRRYANLKQEVMLSEQQLQDYPVARWGCGEWVYCFPADSPEQLTYDRLLPGGQREASRLELLSCFDAVAHQRDVLKRSSEHDAAEIEDLALLHVAGSAAERKCWMLRPGNVPLEAEMMGAIADGFAFRLLDGEVVFVPRWQLADTDQKIAFIATGDDLLEWIEGIDLKELMRHRMVTDGAKAKRVAADGWYQATGGVVDGPFPKLRDASGDRCEVARITALELRKLMAVPGEVRSIGDLQAQMAEKPLREHLARSRDRVPSNLPVLSDHSGRPQPRIWEFGTDRNRIVAALVGRYGDDLVFQQEIDGEAVPFLVAPDALAEDARKRAGRIASELPARDWEQLLPIADNGQYYRLWMTESGDRLLFSRPAVVAAVEDTQADFKFLRRGGERHRFSSTPGEASRYLAALEAGQEQLRRAEAALATWTFRDSPATLHADIIADAGDDVLMRNLQQEEFLLFKAHLDEESRAQLKRLLAQPEIQEAAIAEADESWPRLWVARDGFVGPGFVKSVRADADGYFDYRTRRASSLTYPLSSLTKRERLVVEARWLRKRHDLPDDRSVDQRLAADVPTAKVLTATPPLHAPLEQQINRAAAPRPVHWESQEVKLDPAAAVVAIDAEAASGIVELPNGSWQRVELATGRATDAIQAPASSIGPWLHHSAQNVWWISDGKLMFDDGERRRSISLPETEQAIVAADQSGDFETLLLLLADESLYRLTLETGEAVCVQESSSEDFSQGPAAMVASPDGAAALTYDGNWMRLQGAAEGATEYSPGGAIGLVDRTPGLAAAGRRTAVFTYEDDSRATRLWNRANSRPQSASLPLVPVKMEFMSGPRGELLQMIGRPADSFFADAGCFYVRWTDSDARRDFHNQVIYGEIDEDSLMAANGAALLHRRKGRHVVSRRPDRSLVSPEDVLEEIGRRLVDALDIGQLEAVSDYLEQPEFQSKGEYPGALADAFHRAVNEAIEGFRPHLGGDRLERSRQLAEYFLKVFPRSQVARCTVANWHITTAWDARGDGYAGTVSEMGWTRFRHHIDKANSLLDPLLESQNPSSQVYHQMIAIAMAQGKSLAELKELVKAVLGGPHARNPMIHKSVAIFLLPRWHGTEGMSEAYLERVAVSIGGPAGDAVYAKAISAMRGMTGNRGPVTLDLQWNAERLLAGTKAYYRNRRDAQVIDHSLTVLVAARQLPAVVELVRYCKEHQLVADSIANSDLSAVRAAPAVKKPQTDDSQDRI